MLFLQLKSYINTAQYFINHRHGHKSSLDWLKYTELLEIILLAIDTNWFIAIYTKNKGVRA